MHFEVEYARSGRATCKVCKGKIDKDALRIGAKARADREKLADVENASQIAHMMESTRWHHFQCFPKMKSKKWFAENLIDASASAGFDTLRQEDQEKVTTLFEFSRGADVVLPEVPLAPQEPPVTPAGADKGRKRQPDIAADSRAEDEMTPPQKSAKCQSDGVESSGGLSEDQASQLQRSKNELAKKSIAQLGAMLAKNGLSKSGKKDELVERVAEYRLLGVPPICSACSKGRLRWTRESNRYTCPGHFDEVAKRMRRCKGPAADVEIKRLAWQGDEDLLQASLTASDRGNAGSAGSLPETAAEPQAEGNSVVASAELPSVASHIQGTTVAESVETVAPLHTEAAVITHVFMPEVQAAGEEAADVTLKHVLMPEVQAAGEEAADVKLQDLDVVDIQIAASREQRPVTFKAKSCSPSIVDSGVSVWRQPRPIRRSKYFI